jgi:hypothetical protein
MRRRSNGVAKMPKGARKATTKVFIALEATGGWLLRASHSIERGHVGGESNNMRRSEQQRGCSLQPHLYLVHKTGAALWRRLRPGGRGRIHVIIWITRAGEGHRIGSKRDGRHTRYPARRHVQDELTDFLKRVSSMQSAAT